jgi:hypothetical protein
MNIENVAGFFEKFVDPGALLGSDMHGAAKQLHSHHFLHTQLEHFAYELIQAGNLPQGFQGLAVGRMLERA